MAKDKIKDLDKFDDEFDLDALDDKLFDDFDIDEDTDIDSSSNRSPVTKSKNLFRKGMNGVKSIGVGVGKAVQHAIKQQFPTVTNIVSDVKYGTLELKNELRDLNSEISPTVTELKQFKRRVEPKVRAALGISNVSTSDSEYDEDTQTSSQASDSIDSQISKEVESIFKSNIRKRKLRIPKEDVVDKNIDALISTKRYATQLNAMQEIKSAALLQHGFNTEIFTPYLKKSLELKYRHLYVAQETLALQRSMAAALENKLEQIRHNTALPDDAKVRFSEIFSTTLKQNLSTRISDSIRESIQNILKYNIEENIKPTLELAAFPVSMLGMMLDSYEMEQEMAELTGDKPKSLTRNIFEKGLGFLLGRKLDSKMDKIKGHTGELISRVSGGKIRSTDILENLEGFADIAPGQFALLLENLKNERLSELTEDTDLSERIAKLEVIADVLLPEGSGKTINLKDKLLSDTAQFDYSVKRTIVEAIPGYLSKMLRQLTEINTKRNTEELVYDFTRRTFVTSRMAEDTLIKDIYGSVSTRKYVLDKTKSTIAESLKTEDEISTLETISDDLAIFTNNSIRGRFFPILRPSDLYNAMVEEDVNYNTYTRTVLSGVKNPKALLTFLTTYLFNEDNELNYTNYNKLSKALIKGTTYLENAKDKIISKLKESPYASALLPKVMNTEKLLKDGVYELDDVKIAEILAEKSESADDTLSDEDLKKIMSEKEWKKYILRKKKKALTSVFKSDIKSTISDVVKGNVLKKRESTTGSSGAKFQEASELFRFDTYADEGLSAGVDYLSTLLIDPNSKSGRFLSTTKSYINNTLSLIKDKTKKIKKEVTDNEIYSVSQRIAKIVKRVPNEGLNVLYEIDKIFEEDPDTTIGVLDTSIKMLKSDTSHPSVKPLVDKLIELETKYKNTRKKVSESNINKLLHADTRQEAQSAIKKQWQESQTKKNIDEIINTFQSNESSESEPQNIKTKLQAAKETITTLLNKQPADFEDASTVLSGPTVPDEFTQAIETSPTTKSRLQVIRDKFKIRPQLTQVAKTTEQTATALLEAIKNKIKMSTQPITDKIATGTTTFDEDTQNVLNKQAELLESIAKDTQKLVESVTSIETLVSTLSSSTVAQLEETPNKRSLIGLLLSGTSSVASKILKMGLTSFKLATKGVTTGAILGGKAIGFALTFPFKGIQALLSGIFGSKETSMTDVYTPGPDGKLELLVDKFTLKNFGVFSSGKKVTTVFNITEPVYHSETRDVLISEDNIKSGLYDKDGNELIDSPSKSKFLKKLLSPVKTIAQLPLKYIKWYTKGIRGIFELTYSGIGKLFQKRNPYVDVYLKGQVAPGNQLLYGEGIKRGEYCRLDGTILKSAYEIDSAIYARDGGTIGNCLVTEEHIRHGLVDVHNRSLSSKYSRSIASRVTGAIAKVATTGIGLGIKAAQTAMNTLYALASLPFKGAKALISKTLFDKKKSFDDIYSTISRDDLKILVSDKLDTIITILKRGFRLDVEDDKTGDGLRDNSYEAWKKSKTEKAQIEKSIDKTTARNLQSLLGLSSKIRPTDTQEDSDDGISLGDLLLGGGSVAGAAGWLSNTRLGRWIQNTRLGKWAGKLFGKGATEIATDAASTVTKPGIGSRIRSFIAKYGIKAYKALPTKVKIALALGTTVLGTNMLSDDADATEIKDTTGTTSNTRKNLENANPYKSTTLGDTTTEYTPSSRRDATDYDEMFLEARAVAYGFKEDYTQIRNILTIIEQYAYDEYTKNSPIPDNVLLELASNYIDINENSQSVISYFKEWWYNRVLPVYYTYLKTLESFGIDLNTRDYFGAETDDTTRKLIFETYKSEYKKLLSMNPTMKSLVPSKDGYDVWFVSSQYFTQQNTKDVLKDVKTHEIDKAQEPMSLANKTLLTAGGATSAGILYKYLPKGIKSNIGTVASTGLTGAKSIISKTPILGSAIEGGLVLSDAYASYKEGDTDSTIQKIIRGAGSITGGLIGGTLGTISGTVAPGVGNVIMGAAGYYAGSVIGENIANKLANVISSWLTDGSGPGIFGKPANEWTLFTARAHMYGIDDPAKYERIIEYLEKDAITMVEENNIGEMDDSLAYKFAEKLGYDPKVNTPDKIKHFKLWYIQRFYPIFYAFYKILNSMDIDYDELSSISKKQVNTIMTMLTKACRSVLVNFSEFKPTMESYTKWIKLRDSDILELYEPLDSDVLYEMKNRQDMYITKTSKYTDATEKDRKAALGVTHIKESSGTTPSQPSINTYPQQTSTSTTGGTSLPTTGTLPSSDTTGSGTTPYSVQDNKDVIDNKIGSVSAQFESGGKGSSAIGWDRTGGTSYGKYQFSSKTGALAEFILWLMKNGGSKFATRMIRAVGYAPNALNSKGWGDTGGKTGAPVEAWLAGVAAGELGDLERAYFNSKLNKVSEYIAKGFRFRNNIYPGDPELANMIKENPGLLEMANSTIVQHGVSGGTAILMRAKTDDEIKYVDNVYRLRSTQFASSTPNVRNSVLNRFSRERAMIMELVRRYKSSKKKDDITTGTDSDSNMELLNNTYSVIGESSANMRVGLAAQADTTTSIPAGMSVDRGAISGGNKSNISVSGSTSGPNMASAGASGTTNINITQPNGNTVSNNVPSEGSIKDVKKASSNVDIENLHPRLKQALAGLSSEFKDTFGTPITVTSGYRSPAEQQALYEKYGPGRAARPNPRAPHMFTINGTPAAIAFDADANQLNKAESAGLLNKYGLTRPLWPRGKGRVRPEPWHVQLADTTMMTTAEDLAESTAKPEIVTTVASQVKKANQAYLSSVAQTTQDTSTTPSLSEDSSNSSLTTSITNNERSSGILPTTISSDTPESSSDTQLIKAVSTVPSVSYSTTTSSSLTPSYTSKITDPMKDAGNITDTSSNLEKIAMMQLEQLKMMVMSLTSIDNNTKVLPELNMENLEKPITSLVDNISKALNTYIGSGNTNKSNSGDATINLNKPSQVGLNYNRVIPGIPTVDVSSRRYGI